MVQVVTRQKLMVPIYHSLY